MENVIDSLIKRSLKSKATENFLSKYMYNYSRKKERVLHKYDIVFSTVKLKNGKLLALNPNDAGLSFDVLTSKEKMRERFVSSYLLQNLDKGDTFIDIGANIGYYTFLLSDYFENIIAVEPILDNVKFLYWSRALNGMEDKVKIYHAAVGEYNGYIYMVDSKFKNWSHISKNNEGIKTKIVDLPKLYDMAEINGNVDLIKMDVEGYEYEIIIGNKKFLKEHPPKRFFLELHIDALGKEKTKEILEFLKECKYFVEGGFVDYPPIYFRIGKLIRGIYKGMMKYGLYKRRIGQIYKNVSIDEILNDENTISGKNGSIEFIFKRGI